MTFAFKKRIKMSKRKIITVENGYFDYVVPMQTEGFWWQELHLRRPGKIMIDGYFDRAGISETGWRIRTPLIMLVRKIFKEVDFCYSLARFLLPGEFRLGCQESYGKRKNRIF